MPIKDKNYFKGIASAKPIWKLKMENIVLNASKPGRVWYFNSTFTTNFIHNTVFILTSGYRINF